MAARDSTSNHRREERRVTRPHVRATLVTKSGTTSTKPGARYAVKVYARSGIGRTADRKLVAVRRLTARAFAVGSSRRAPSCADA